MAMELGRTPAPARAPAFGVENARPGGASTPAPAEPGAAYRPPLRAIQPPGQPRRPVPTPNKGLGFRAAGKTPVRVGAVTTPLRPTNIPGKPKPVLRSGFSTTGATSAQVQHSMVRGSILLREENHNVQVCTKLCDKLGSHGIVKPKQAARSLATPLRMNAGMEEQVAQNKPEHYDLRESMAPGDRKDALSPPLSRLALPASIEYLRDSIEGALGLPVPDCSKLLPCLQEHISDLQEELLAHLHEEKEARDQHVAKLEEDFHAAALRIHHLEKESAMNAQEKEAREQLAAHAAKLEEDLHAAALRIHHLEMECTMNARRCMEEKEAREQLAAHAAKLEEDLHAAALRIHHLEKESVMNAQEKEACDQLAAHAAKLEEDLHAATLRIHHLEISEERKTYAEAKNKAIKLLEMSIEDAEITVCSLEEKVKLLEEEAEQRRRQQEKLEVDLQHARQQLLVVPSSRGAKSSMEDRMVDSPDPIRHPSNINNGVLRSQEIRTGKEACESVVMMAFCEEQTQGSYASSFGDIFKEAADDSIPASHSLPHIASLKRNPNAVEEAVELDTIAVESTPLVEHQEEPGEPSSDECMQEADPSDLEMAKDFWSENSEFEHPSASVESELFGGGAGSDQSLSVFDSEEQVPRPAVESVIEVLKENELPPVSLVRPNDPVSYTLAPSDELERLRSRNHYEGHRTATDRRFWSIEQQDLYNSIYSRAQLFPMKWIDWQYIDSIDEFSCVRQRCAHVGLENIMSYRCDWDSELIRQFYSTVHISDDNGSMTWMANGRRITTNKRAWEERFGISGSVHTAVIHSEFLLEDDDKRIMYTAAECTVGQTRGLSPLASIANKIIRKTIYPKNGGRVYGHNWNILRHIVEQHPFDIIALIFDEIELLISDSSRTNLLYAPYIMGMIMRAFEYDGPRETRHRSYKPRPAPAVAAPSEPPPSAFQPEVEAHVEADDHSQFEEAGHWPQGEAVQHTNGSSLSQIQAPRSSLTPSLESTTPSPPPAPAAFPEQASMMHAGLRCFSSASCFGAKSF